MVIKYRGWYLEAQQSTYIQAGPGQQMKMHFYIIVWTSEFYKSDPNS